MKESLAKAPGIQIVETYDIKEDPVRCAELITTGTNRYPDLGAWLSVGGWPVFTRNATAAVDPAKTKVISFDTIQPALDLLREGKVTVLLGQKYFGWGSEPVKILYDIKHGKMPSSPIIDSGVDVVTKDNVEAYAAKFKQMESGS
jgi:ribose transport system substrate-binding protein